MDEKEVKQVKKEPTKEEKKIDPNAPVAIIKNGVTVYRMPSELEKYKAMGWAVK